VKVTEIFSGGDIPIDGLPSTVVELYIFCFCTDINVAYQLSHILGVEWPAKRCDISFVAGSVQEQAQDVLVPPLLRNCLTPNDTFFSQ